MAHSVGWYRFRWLSIAMLNYRMVISQPYFFFHSCWQWCIICFFYHPQLGSNWYRPMDETCELWSIKTCQHLRFVKNHQYYTHKKLPLAGLWICSVFISNINVWWRDGQMDSYTHDRTQCVQCWIPIGWLTSKPSTLMGRCQTCWMTTCFALKWCHEIHSHFHSQVKIVSINMDKHF